MLGRGKSEGPADREAEKAREKEAKAAAAHDKQAQLERSRYLDSPVGRAERAYAAEHGFFEIQLPLAEMKRDAMAQGFSVPGTAAYRKGFGVSRTQGGSRTDTLSSIEAVGWRLEHVGYACVMTGQVSRDKLLSSGQEVGIMGELIGIYLFRRDDSRVEPVLDDPPLSTPPVPSPPTAAPASPAPPSRRGTAF